MKKALLIAGICLAAAACAKQQPLCVHTEPVAVAPDATNGDEYLYTITYNDLDFFGAGEIMKSFFEINDVKPAGCSAVRNGRFYGRNLDYYVNGNVDFIITTTAGKGRYASLGTSADYPLSTKERLLNGSFTEEDYAAIAYYMTDGINEKGVAINGNVVPCDECDRTTGTNPGAPTVVTNGVVRYVLDNAASVDEAVELLRGINIVVPSREKFPFEEHWMISDKDKSVVVEIWNNELVVVEDCTITNFYVSHPESAMGIGHERYDILKANYDEGTSVEGMHNLMKRVWYSNAYSSKADPLWYSDTLEEGCGFTWNDIKVGNVEKSYEMILKDEQQYESVDAQKQLRNATNWYTTHSIVYDLEAKTMSLIAQENDTVWDFSL